MLLSFYDYNVICQYSVLNFFVTLIYSINIQPTNSRRKEQNIPILTDTTKGGKKTKYLLF